MLFNRLFHFLFGRRLSPFEESEGEGEESEGEGATRAKK